MRKAGGIAVLAAILAITLTGIARAEVVTAVVPLTTAAEITPPLSLPAGAKGTTSLTINIIRDSNGNITSGIVNFLTSFSFPGAVTITGHHIHEGAATVNGPIVIDPSLSGSTTVFPTGSGVLNVTAIVTNTEVLKRLLANSSGFYVNLHTSANPAGAIRGQIRKVVETIANTVEMTLASEVPPITDVSGIGVGTITINVRRGALGEVIGGTVTFTVNYDFLGEQRFSGLHIHEQVFGVNGPVVINTGLSATNLLIAPTGRGTLSIPVEITAATLDVFKRLLANPPGFYVNIHTTVKPGGVVRGQLTRFSVPPSLLSSSSYVLNAGGTIATLTFSGTGLDAGTVIVMNDQLAMTSFDPETGLLTAVVPPSVQANAGQIFVQARRSDGLRSLPLVVVAAAPANINAATVATTDSARFAPTIAPDAISSTFGASLASTTLSASTAILPTVLDGSSLFVNGAIASLFFVSPNQINFLAPASTLPGTASVVVVAKDGKVSQGTVSVAPTISAIFTSKADGTGAPAARASANGTTFNIAMGLADGTPVAVDAGNFVMMFATGLRNAAVLPSLTIGGTAVTPSFAGPQGTFFGQDQVNFQIPTSLAGRGDVDLVMTVDGKTSNTVRLRIK
ncbi:MAG: CHRD domain-containing protein [Acidobacteriota bacterium]